MTNIQGEVQKIHSQFGTSEMANYKIQLLCDEYGKQQWNEAIKLAAEEATFDKKYVPSKVDKQSILKLLK